MTPTPVNRSTSHQVPPWAHAPSQEWKLIEIKGGIEIGSYVLSKASTVLGRCAEEVDIELSHASCSRRHARIAFDSRGFPWLRDLQSTHGTLVNKRPLPKEAIGTTESSATKKGSRGVILYVGDVLAFGASTRIYSLEGPPEYDRGNSKATMAAASSTATITTALKSSTESMSTQQHEKNTTVEEYMSSGVSWGMDMDDPSDYQSQDNSSSVDIILEKFRSDPSQIPKSMYRMFEKLSQKKAKLENLERESERIRQKGSADELTQGQTNQLERNDGLQRKLLDEIQQVEGEILELSGASKGTGTAKRSRKQHDEDDDVDDFYDKTVKRDYEDSSSEAESEEVLVRKWKAQYQSLNELKVQLAKYQQQFQDVKRKLARACEEDAFFVHNELSISQEQIEKTLSERKHVEGQMNQTERLLHIVNSKLVCDRTSGHVGFASSMPPPPSDRMENSPQKEAISMPPSTMDLTTNPTHVAISSMPSPPPSDTMKQTFQTDGGSMPPPASFSVTTLPMNPAHGQIQIQTSHPQGGNTSLMQPPPTGGSERSPAAKKRRTHGPSLPPTALADSGVGAIDSRNRPMSTLAALSAGISRSKKAGESRQQRSNDTKLKTADPTKDEWQAPQGQDGSGITKLNEKFKGRY